MSFFPQNLSFLPSVSSISKAEAEARHPFSGWLASFIDSDCCSLAFALSVLGVGTLEVVESAFASCTVSAFVDEGSAAVVGAVVVVVVIIS